MKIYCQFQYTNKTTKNTERLVTVFKKGSKAFVMVQDLGKDGLIQNFEMPFTELTGDSRVKTVSSLFYLYQKYPQLLTMPNGVQYTESFLIRSDYNKTLLDGNGINFYASF